MRSTSKRAIACALFAACGGETPRPVNPGAVHAPLSLAADDHMVIIPAGKYIAGSTPEERSAAYDDFQSATNADTAREEKWFDREEDRHQTTLAAFAIDLMPVTQSQYAEFVSAGRAKPPVLSAPDPDLARFGWTSTAPPDDRLDHPVVLVSWDDANRYCMWRGELRGRVRRLPTAAEFEKAARGASGLAYPWGNAFEPARLNSADGGPKDTVSAGSFAAGASPFGVLDMAGNVMQWTSTAGAAGTMLAKGSAWGDHAGVGRAAFSKAHATGERHAHIGFRCAGAP